MSDNKNKKNKKNSKTQKIGLKKILTNTCCIFTVLIFAIYALNTVFSEHPPRFATSLANTAAIFALAFVASAATLVYDSKKLPFWEAHTIVFLAAGALYYLIVICIPGLSSDTKKTVVGMGLYVAAFLIITVFILIFRKRKKTKKQKIKESEYENKF